MTVKECLSGGPTYRNDAAHSQGHTLSPHVRSKNRIERKHPVVRIPGVRRQKCVSPGSMCLPVPKSVCPSGLMLKKACHQRPFIVGGRLKAILQGYFNYFAVPGNLTVLDHFRTAVVRMWIKVMRRRSQKGKYIPWRRYARLITLFIPKARAVHPYPSQRWCV